MGTSEAVLEISRQTAYIEALSNTEQRRGTHCEGGEFLDISIPSSQARLLSKRLSIAFPKPPTTSAVNIAGLYAAAKELLSKLQAKVPKIVHAKLIEVVYGSYETSKVMPLIVLKVWVRELVGTHTDEFIVHFEEFPAGFYAGYILTGGSVCRDDVFRYLHLCPISLDTRLHRGLCCRFLLHTTDEARSVT